MNPIGQNSFSQRHTRSLVMFARVMECKSVPEIQTRSVSAWIFFAASQLSILRQCFFSKQTIFPPFPNSLKSSHAGRKLLSPLFSVHKLLDRLSISLSTRAVNSYEHDPLCAARHEFVRWHFLQIWCRPRIQKLVLQSVLASICSSNSQIIDHRRTEKNKNSLC